MYKFGVTSALRNSGESTLDLVPPLLIDEKLRELVDRQLRKRGRVRHRIQDPLLLLGAEVVRDMPVRVVSSVQGP